MQRSASVRGGAAGSTRSAATLQPSRGPAAFPPALQLERLKLDLFATCDPTTIRIVQTGAGGGDVEVYQGQLDAAGRRHGAGTLTWGNGNVYVGPWHAGAMHGSRGTFFYAAEMDRFDGDFEHGKKHGRGAYVFANGNVYRGDFRDDRRNGRGVYTWQCGDTYDGEWMDGRMHGAGVTRYANGNVYDGAFIEDRREGHGTLTCSDGLVYSGEWRRNNRHGRGKISFPSGDYYDGEWADDKKHGHGCDAMKNGSRFEGGYVHNVRCGAGTMIFANGDTYAGEFRDDKMHGRGRYSFSNGFVYDGEWHADMRHGSGRYTFPSGHVYEGAWSNDRRNGSGQLTVFNGGQGGLARAADVPAAGNDASEGALCERYVGAWLEGKMHGDFEVFLLPAATATAAAATPPWRFRLFTGAWANGVPAGAGCFAVPVGADPPSVLLVRGHWGKADVAGAGDGTVPRPPPHVLCVLRAACQQQLALAASAAAAPSVTSSWALAAPRARSARAEASNWWQLAASGSDPWASQQLLAACAPASVATERQSHSPSFDLRAALVAPVVARAASAVSAVGLGDRALLDALAPAACARQIRDGAEPPADEVARLLATGGCYDVSLAKGLLQAYAASSAANATAHVGVLGGLAQLATAAAQEGSAVRDDVAGALRNAAAAAAGPDGAAREADALPSEPWAALRALVALLPSLEQRRHGAELAAAAASGEAGALDSETERSRARLRALDADATRLSGELQLRALVAQEQLRRDAEREAARVGRLAAARGDLAAAEAARHRASAEHDELRERLERATALEAAAGDAARRLREDLQAQRSEATAIALEIQRLGGGSAAADGAGGSAGAGGGGGGGLGVYRDIAAAEQRLAALEARLSRLPHGAATSASAAAAAVTAPGSSAMDAAFAAVGSRLGALSHQCRGAIGAAADLRDAEAERASLQRDLAAAQARASSSEVDKLRAAIASAQERLQRLQQQEKDARARKEASGQLAALQRQLDKVVLAQEQELLNAQNALAMKRQAIAALTKARDELLRAAAARQRPGEAQPSPGAATLVRGAGDESGTAPASGGSTPRLQCSTDMVPLAGGGASASSAPSADKRLHDARQKVERRRGAVRALREEVVNQIAALRRRFGDGVASDGAGAARENRGGGADTTAAKESLVHQCLALRATAVQAMRRDLARRVAERKTTRRSQRVARGPGARDGASAIASPSDSSDADSSGGDGNESLTSSASPAAGAHAQPSTGVGFAAELAAAIARDRGSQRLEGAVAALQSKLRIVQQLETDCARVPALEERLRQLTRAPAR
jgi:hypothetical protein